MNRPLQVFLFIMAPVALSTVLSCPSPATQCKIDSRKGEWLPTVVAADLDILTQKLRGRGFTTRWIRAGTVLYAKHPDIPGGVVIENIESASSFRVARQYRKRPGAEVTPELLARINRTNLHGYVKVYVDTNGNFWTEMYYCYRPGISLDGFVNFITAFAKDSAAVAKKYYDYLE